MAKISLIENSFDPYCNLLISSSMMLSKLILMLLIPSALYSHSLTQERAGRFAYCLFHNADSLRGFFAESTLQMSERLGIQYESKDLKALISYDFNDSVRKLVNDHQLGYSILIEDLGEDYSKLKIKVNDKSIHFYFRDSLCISSLEFLCRNWVTRESEHFKFAISNTLLFNDNNIESLERFLMETAAKLELSASDLNRLGKEKILYYLCRDENEIRELTGYEAKGMYNLAFDAIVTVHNTHFHELVHLLVNYKLSRLPLFTHPLVQEGIAVAFGGRGGMSNQILLRLGSYLFTSGLVDLNSLLSKTEFSKLDPSLSYPASGIICDFWVNRNGMNKFLDMYRNHSGSAEDERVKIIQAAEVGDTIGLREFLDKKILGNEVHVDTFNGPGRFVINEKSLKIKEDGDRYYFETDGLVAISTSKHWPKYQSKKFHDLNIQADYNGEKYLVRADKDEVAVYDLYNNEIIAGFFGSFHYPAVSIPKNGNNYIFSVEKSIFDELLQESRIEVVYPNVEHKK